jgi:hypothetical protein
MITIAVVMASFLVIGCGDSPTGSLILDDGDGTYVPPGNAGGGPNTDLNGKGSDENKYSGRHGAAPVNCNL